MDVPICPKCGNTKLDRETIKYRKFPADTFECKNCDYKGTCPIIDQKDVKAFQEHLKEQNNYQSEE